MSRGGEGFGAHGIMGVVFSFFSFCLFKGICYVELLLAWKNDNA